MSLSDRTASAPPDTASVLSVDSLSVSYKTSDGRLRALRDITFDIREGEVLGVAGESGSGKSTLGFAIMRYLGDNGQVDSGSITVGGIDVTEASSAAIRELRGATIAHSAQDPKSALNPSLRVGEQIKETVLANQDISEAAAWERTIETLDQLNIPEPEFNAKKYPHQLSGGMQQRVMFAIALSCTPDILILDEPTTGLDVTTQSKLLDIVDDLTEHFDTSILFITHDLGVLARISDRILILYAGEMMELGPTSDLIKSPAHPYTQGLISALPETSRRTEIESIQGKIPQLTNLPEGCIFADRCDYAAEECRKQSIPVKEVIGSEEHVARCIRLDEVAGLRQRNALKDASALDHRQHILEVKNVKKYYRSSSLLDRVIRRENPVKAVDGVSFEVNRGESFGVVGESGCGKSTLGSVLVNLLENDSGQVRFDGTPIADMDSATKREFRSEVQIVFQNPRTSLNPRKRVVTILKRPLARFTDLEGADIESRVVELLDQVGLNEDYLRKYPHELSGGEQQRVAIARAFTVEPSLVILDEPVSALDVSVQASIIDLLNDLRDVYNTSYVFISHDLGVVRQLCNRVGIMYLGEFVEIGPIEQIFDAPKHPYTEALLASVPELDDAFDESAHYLLEGEVPSARNPPSGCRFHTRCDYARKSCQTDAPTLQSVETDHTAACHRNTNDHPYWESESIGGDFSH